MTSLSLEKRVRFLSYVQTISLAMALFFLSIPAVNYLFGQAVNWQVLFLAIITLPIYFMARMREKNLNQ